MPFSVLHPPPLRLMADGALMLTCVTYGRASASVCSVRAVFVVLMWMTMRQITSISSRGNQRFRLDVIAVFGFAVLARVRFLLVRTALWFQSWGAALVASLPAFLHSLDYFSKVVSWKLSAGEEGEPRQDSQSTPTKSWPNCVPDIAP